jgi:uncharacterized small protein (DUF1192 family)
LQEKVAHYSRAVEQVGAELQAERKARAEAEDQAQAASQEGSGIQAELEERIAALDEQVTRLQSALEAERRARAAAEEDARARIEAAAKAGEEPDAAIGGVESPEVPDSAGICECCGADSQQKGPLSRIDSGQQLCPDCLRDLGLASTS